MAPSFEMLLVAFFVGGVANSLSSSRFFDLSASVDEARHGRPCLHWFDWLCLAPLTMAGLAYEFDADCTDYRVHSA